MKHKTIKKYEKLLSNEEWTTTMVRVSGQDILMETESTTGVMRGWVVEGDLDVNWADLAVSGKWPAHLQ